MIAQPQPLIEVFAEIPDFRRCRGKRHPLPAILSLTCCAMLCGYRSYSAIAEWGRNYGTRIAHALGFTSQHTVCGDAAHGLTARGPRCRGSKIGRLGRRGHREHTRGALGGRSRHSA